MIYRNEDPIREIAMDTVSRLIQISSRIDHLENSADWIARETVHSDNGVSQTATLVSVLATEVRDLVCNLVRDLEEEVESEEIMAKFH